MATATITSKGQTTVPVEIRNFLHLTTGDRIEFIIEEEGKVSVRPVDVDIKELKGILPRPKKPISLDEMDQAVRMRSVKKCTA